MDWSARPEVEPVHGETRAARPARHAPLARPLPAPIAHLEPDDGWWSHQAEAIDRIRDGESVVVATGTGSGKSRCFQVPVAEAVVTGIRAGTSLLIYPTKALAHDQLRSLEALRVPGLVASTYDADAGRDERTFARQKANVVLTNPEMLHHGLLANHRRWQRLLGRLEYVVVDELHTLRGVFGANVAHLLRRLRRVAADAGANPRFVFTSATIGNPGELAAQLCGVPVTVVDDDGSPRGPQELHLVDGRHSTSTTAADLVVGEVLADRRVVAFCASRNQTERLAAMVAASLPPELRGSVEPYRSGFRAEERREIEERLSSGALRAVITTSALELGIDIAGLDTTVLCGFPGTVASMWQQIGRAGRAGAEGRAIVVAGRDQLDQWWLDHPEELFHRSPEPGVVNVGNPYVGQAHVRCAAYEHPLAWTDLRWWPELDEGVARGVRDGDLSVRSGRFGLPTAVWAGRGIPHPTVGVRSAGGGTVRIVDEGDDLIGTVERRRAPALVHEGAVYLHRGRSWRVRELDLDDRRAVVAPHEGIAWTRSRTDTTVTVERELARRSVGRAELSLVEVEVTNQVVGFDEITPGSDTPDRTVELELPPDRLHTLAVRYEWTTDVAVDAGLTPLRLRGALHAAEHAAIGMLPLFAICDRSDVGGLSVAADPTTDLPTVYLYDGHPGGAGIAQLAYDRADDHLALTAEAIAACGCDAGCPSCVQSPKCGNANEHLDKHAALALLQVTLGPAEPF